jgi:hypothetical protein
MFQGFVPIYQVRQKVNNIPESRTRRSISIDHTDTPKILHSVLFDDWFAALFWILVFDIDHKVSNNLLLGLVSYLTEIPFSIICPTAEATFPLKAIGRIIT